MGKWVEEVEELVHRGRIKVPYNWSVGEIGSKFFSELRDHKKIWGTRCPSCKKVLVPARKICGQCFEETNDWVQVGSEGALQTYTVVRYSSGVQPLEPPFGYAIILLDGADTGMTHLLYGSDPSLWRVGIRVQAVFRDKREGNILDISYFQPIVS